jgi:hypothetical protein
MRNPAVLASLFTPERDEIEAGWLVEPPGTAEAFARHSELIDRWTGAVAARDDGTDVRPWWVRRYWRKREAMAG